MSAQRVDVESITVERLAKWAILLVDDHATPALLIGIGHDEHVGDVSICIPDGMTFDDTATLLEGVARKLRSRA